MSACADVSDQRVIEVGTPVRVIVGRLGVRLPGAAMVSASFVSGCMALLEFR